MTKMNVLIACEFSGIVREAFKARGHNAWSCDLLPTEIPGQHVQEDAVDLIAATPYTFGWSWDLMIAHPPCTHFAGSGARWLTDHWVKKKKAPGGRYWWDGSKKREAQKMALKFVYDLWEAPIPMIALENPVGMLSNLWQPPTQYIHPWQHGHGETKKTGLWLKNLPRITPTDIVPGRKGAVWMMTPGPEREKDRSRTYPGIAQAMAEQWG